MYSQQRQEVHWSAENMMRSAVIRICRSSTKKDLHIFLPCALSFESAQHPQRFHDASTTLNKSPRTPLPPSWFVSSNTGSRITWRIHRNVKTASVNTLKRFVAFFPPLRAFSNMTSPPLRQPQSSSHKVYSVRPTFPTFSSFLRC